MCVTAGDSRIISVEWETKINQLFQLVRKNYGFHSNVLCLFKLRSEDENSLESRMFRPFHHPRRRGLITGRC